MAYWLLEMNCPNSYIILSATLSCVFLAAFSRCFQSLNGFIFAS